MLNYFKQLRARVFGPHSLPVDPKLAAHASYFYEHKKGAEELSDIISNLSLFERWQLLRCFLEKKQSIVFHFLHVPKTGGTTFGETLSKDKKTVTISVDAAPLTLAKQLIRLVNASPTELVLTRAHHGLALAYDSGCAESFKFIFSAYREPKAIHISNVNMIMRRLNNALNTLPENESEQLFCKFWQKNLPSKFEYTQEFALKLLLSSAYRREMGQVYTRFYNVSVSRWRKLIRKKQLLILPSEQFDHVFTEVFNYEKLPPRKNVSSNPLLTGIDVQDEQCSHLITTDSTITSYLEKHLCTAKDLKKALFSE